MTLMPSTHAGPPLLDFSLPEVVRFADVQYCGLLISDRQAGPFNIELMQIAAE